MQVTARVEQEITVRRSKPVPGTDFLTNVAASNPVAHERMQRWSNFATVLNGQVTDTTLRIQPVALGVDAVGGASINATGAGAAMVRLDFALLGGVFDW